MDRETAEKNETFERSIYLQGSDYKEAGVEFNKELLLKVKQTILEEPRRLRMDHWLISLEGTEQAPSVDDPGYLKAKSQYTETHVRTITELNGEKAFQFYEPLGSTHDPTVQVIPPCNTVGCIAGWATMLSIKDMTQLLQFGVQDFIRNGRRLLGLSDNEANVLFYISHWPESFRDEYKRYSEDSSFEAAQKRADIVGRVIDKFIEYKEQHAEQEKLKVL